MPESRPVPLLEPAVAGTPPPPAPTPWVGVNDAEGDFRAGGKTASGARG